MLKVNIEVTDTFGHEANYTWVRRYSFETVDCTSDYSIVRRAKREMGWSGKRCATFNQGDMIELRPYGECIVAFITCETVADPVAAE
jgi:hypothetical protein